MGFVCAICSDSVGNSPGEEASGSSRTTRSFKSHLVATLCGHVFHTYCLNKWLDSDLESSNQCPNCRKRVKKDSYLHLFLDSYDDSSPSPHPPGSPVPGSSSSSLSTKCAHLETQNSELKAKLLSVEADFKIQQTIYELQKQDSDKRHQDSQADIRKKDVEIGKLKDEFAKAKDIFDGEINKLRKELELATHDSVADRTEKRKLENRMHMFLHQKSFELQAFFTDFANFKATLDPVYHHGSSFNVNAPSPVSVFPGIPANIVKSSSFGIGKGIGNHNKPRRGKKMVYEKYPDPEDIVDVKDDSSDEDDVDIIAGPDSRKRKLIPVTLRPSSGGKGSGKNIKMRKLSCDILNISMSPITISSDSEPDAGNNNAISTAREMETDPSE